MIADAETLLDRQLNPLQTSFSKRGAGRTKSSGADTPRRAVKGPRDISDRRGRFNGRGRVSLPAESSAHAESGLFNPFSRTAFQLATKVQSGIAARSFAPMRTTSARRLSQGGVRPVSMKCDGSVRSRGGNRRVHGRRAPSRPGEGQRSGSRIASLVARGAIGGDKFELPRSFPPRMTKLSAIVQAICRRVVVSIGTTFAAGPMEPIKRRGTTLAFTPLWERGHHDHCTAFG